MKLATGSAARLTFFLHADAFHHHRSVTDEIIQRALEAGLAGATRFHGVEGFGRTRVVHTDIDPDISSGLPCEVVVVDSSADQLRAFHASVADLVDHGVAVLDRVEVAHVAAPRHDDA